MQRDAYPGLSCVVPGFPAIMLHLVLHLNETAILRFENGKLAERWGAFDRLTWISSGCPLEWQSTAEAWDMSTVLRMRR